MRQSMAGKLIHVGSCVQNSDKQKHQIEMDNISSLRGSFLSLEDKQPYDPLRSLQAVYIQTKLVNPGISHGSITSLDSKFVEQSDVIPLTEKHLCHYEECKKFHSSDYKKDIENPVSPLKNFFFYFVLVMLLIWILIYTILNRMNYI